LKVKPAVGFTLPSAGLSPAPSERKKMRDFVPAGKLVGGRSLCVRFPFPLWEGVRD
jgi:hypothetical protein